jgi:cysteine desulfurase
MSRPRPIYLDYAATTPLDQSAAQAMDQAAQAGYANPASQHAAGRAARKVLEDARERIVERVGGTTAGMHADQLIFTSGGTEANNLALLGLMGRPPARALVSAIEHPSVSSASDELQRRGHRVDRIRVDSSGVIDLDHAATLLADSPPPRLVSVMLVNNETGVIQPIEQLSQLCSELAIPLHVDVVQAVGQLDMRLHELAFAAATVSAHKFGGPPGIGAVLLRAGVKIEPIQFGGFQQSGIRPGTESVPLAIGFAAALEQHFVARKRPSANRVDFEKSLLERLDYLVINGGNAPRAPHISNVAFLGVDRQQLFLALDFAGVYCSTGSACASGSSEPSPVLRAMGLPEEVVASSLRFSFGAPTTMKDVNEAVERIVTCVKRLRRSA